MFNGQNVWKKDQENMMRVIQIREGQEKNHGVVSELGRPSAVRFGNSTGLSS